MLYRRWPYWWDDPVIFTPHAYERMAERGLTETEARLALDACTTIKAQEGRETWIAVCRRKETTWIFIVKPDLEARNLVVITMYPLQA